MKKLTIATATLLGTALLSPLTASIASADPIDDYLDKIPSGEISCAQAAKYYTNPGDYNSKKRKALAVAHFHPRGGEIRSAVARADEAIARCGLNSPGAQKHSTGAPAGRNHAPAPAGRNHAPAPAGAPAPAPAERKVIPLFVQPGQPTVDIPSGDVLYRIPDVLALAQQANLGSSR